MLDWTSGYPYGKTIIFDLYLMLHTKTYSKWIINLNVKAKVMKLLEEKIGANLCNLVLGNYSSDRTQKSMNHKKPKNNQLDFIESKSFPHKKITIT